jgi:hypothetical protein
VKRASAADDEFRPLTSEGERFTGFARNEFGLLVPDGLRRKGTSKPYPHARPGSRAQGRGKRARADKGHVQVWHAPHELDGPGFRRRRSALSRCRPGELPVLYRSES